MKPDDLYFDKRPGPYDVNGPPRGPPPVPPALTSFLCRLLGSSSRRA